MKTKIMIVAALGVIGMASISYASKIQPADSDRPMSVSRIIPNDSDRTYPDSFHDNPAENRIRSFYTQILGRQPDPQGVGYWLNKYKNGMSLEEIEQRFRVTAHHQMIDNPFNTNNRVKQAAFSQCQLNNCGDFPQNVADMQANLAAVGVQPDGQMIISIQGLIWKGTGAPVGQKTLQVFLGNFSHMVFDGSPVGFIKTDMQGNFQGTVETGNNSRLTCGSGDYHLMQVVLNDPDVRSEFVTVPVDCKVEVLIPVNPPDLGENPPTLK